VSPEVLAWVGQVPWVPLILVLGVIGGAVLGRRGGKKRAEALGAKLAAGALVVDVRTKAEYASGHYPGAVNHPVDGLKTSAGRLGALDRPLIVHCASGTRSARAAVLLRNAGFTDVTDAGTLARLPPRP